MRLHQLEEGWFFKSAEQQMRDQMLKDMKKNKIDPAKKAKKLQGELYDPIITKTLIKGSIEYLNDGEFENAPARWKNIKHSLIGMFNIFKNRMSADVLSVINDLDNRFDFGGQIFGIMGGDDNSVHPNRIRNKKDALIRELTNLAEIIPNTPMDGDGNEVSDDVLSIYAKEYISKEYKSNDIVGRQVIDNFKKNYL